MRSKVFVLLVLFLFFSLRIWQSTGCKQFSGFYFNPLAIKINVESQVSLDSSLPRSYSRFFHNKLSAGVFEYGKALFSIYEPNFILQIAGPLEVFLLILSTIYIFGKKKILGFLNLALIFFISFLYTTTINPKVSFLVFSLSLFIYSLWGLKILFERRLYFNIFLFLIPVTILYFAYSWQLNGICNEIFFH